MSEEREPIIDALLEELLGDQQPPDLTQKILEAHEASLDSSIDVGRVAPSPTNSGPSDLDSHPTIRPAVTSRKKRRSNANRWQGWASAAVVLIAAVGFYAWVQATSQPQLAKQKTVAPNASTDVASDEPQPQDDEAFNQEAYFPDGPSTQIAATDSSTEPNQAVIPEIGLPNATDVAVTADDADPFDSPEFNREIQLLDTLSDSKLVSTINRDLSKKWKLASWETTGAISDRQWFYRSFRFLLGRAPKADEMGWFQRSLDREAAVDKMLVSSMFQRRWAKFLSNVFVGNTSNSNPVEEPVFEEYLEQSLAEDKSYDQLAFELLTAAGSDKPGEADFNPATNFLLAHQQIEWTPSGQKMPYNRIGVTEKVAQVFLGKQLQCARCHDHNGITQDQYYQMVSFFTQLRSDNGRKGEVSKILNGDYPGSDSKRPNYDEADVFFTRHRIGETESNAIGVSVYPRFLDGREVPSPSGRIRDINRREELAKLIVTSDAFSEAFVNRVWDEALGYGFTQPIDDMGTHNPPTHPELLQTLSENFRNSGFDIKPLLKWIVLSQAFDRRTRAASDSLVGRPDGFASFARRDTDLLYRSVPGAIKESALALSEGRVPNVNAQIGSDDESNEKEATRRARLQVRLNAKEEFLKSQYGSLLKALAENQKLTNLDRVIHVFLATVGRLPTQYERDRGVEILEAKRSLQQGLRDIGLVLLNSREFDTLH